MRQSERAAATRQAIMDAARDVFTAAGFSDANVADVVSRAGASVGSLYHHFGGKADLYLALFEDYQQRQEERSARAVAIARSEGASPVELFVTGSRAYLRGCWEERDLARLFLAGGGPAGFELAARRRFHEWAHLNELLLAPLGADGQGPSADALVLVLTSVVAEAGRAVATCDNEREAERLIADVVTLIARLAAPQAGA